MADQLHKCCPECHGEGVQIYGTVTAGKLQFGDEHYNIDTCHTCGGIGRILIGPPEVLVVPVIETCSIGHQYAYLDDHPRDRYGNKRCPHCMATGLDAARRELEQYAHDEEIFRCGWAIAYSGPNLYRGVGELQDNAVQPGIDWKRDSAYEIRAKITRRALDAFNASGKGCVQS